MESYTFWLTLAVVIGALALVAQAVCLYLVCKAFERLEARTREFIPRAEQALAETKLTLAEAKLTLAQTRDELTRISAKTNQVLDLAHGQMTRVDQFVSDATGRARVQMDRIETLVDESLGRTRHAVALLGDTVTRPVREMNAVSAGLTAAFRAFFTKRRSAEPVEEEEAVPQER